MPWGRDCKLPAPTAATDDRLGGCGSRAADAGSANSTSRLLEVRWLNAPRALETPPRGAPLLVD
jgi:hypothetical protein